MDLMKGLCIGLENKITYIFPSVSQCLIHFCTQKAPFFLLNMDWPLLLFTTHSNAFSRPPAEEVSTIVSFT